MVQIEKVAPHCCSRPLRCVFATGYIRSVPLLSIDAGPAGAETHATTASLAPGMAGVVTALRTCGRSRPCLASAAITTIAPRTASVVAVGPHYVASFGATTCAHVADYICCYLRCAFGLRHTTYGKEMPSVWT